MSLNHFVNSEGKLLIHTKSVKTDELLIKMHNNSYINFVLPNFGSVYEVLSTDGNGKLKWINNDNNVSSVFCCREDNLTDFQTEVDLGIIMIPLRTGNFFINNNSKILLKTSLIYMWTDDELPIDFDIIVYVNGIDVSISTEGLNTMPDVFNKFSNEIIVDINAGDILSIKLKKINLESTKFLIKKNSFYSVELL